ncbi:MAG: magnesium transporter CorA family protein [Candidatus Thorarchaeota archaeon]|nr:MAG: magnesium transporter CorA family protein [Candidatus Thorarchaeota archaeon]
MSSDKPENGSISIMALESGIKYASIEEAPDVPLLIEIVGIRPNDLSKISQRFEIDLEDLQDVQDLDERPRLQIEDKFTMIVLRVPVNLKEAKREYSTNPIGIFTNGKDIIVIQNDEVPIRKERLRKRIRYSTTVADIIYKWLEIVIHSFETTLDLVEATINETEDVIMSEIYPSQLEWFFQLSRDAIFMETSLKANAKVLRRLKRYHIVGRLILDVDRLEELEVDLQQQVELSAIYRELIANAMSAYDSMVSHNLNKVIKTLTSVSLLVSVPTLIASVYGMNVGLPLEEEPLAFVVIMFTSLLITLPLLFFLRTKGLV